MVAVKVIECLRILLWEHTSMSMITVIAGRKRQSLQEIALTRSVKKIMTGSSLNGVLNIRIKPLAYSGNNDFIRGYDTGRTLAKTI